MQYRKDKKGNNISLLGFGCMRFEGGGIGDYFQKANDQVMEAIRHAFKPEFINRIDEIISRPIYESKMNAIS